MSASPFELVTKWKAIISICGLVAIVSVLIIGAFVVWSVSITSPVIVVLGAISALLFCVGM